MNPINPIPSTNPPQNHILLTEDLEFYLMKSVVSLVDHYSKFLRYANGTLCKSIRLGLE